MIYLFYCILFFLFSCDNPLTNEEDKNCILDLGGFYDDCGVCVGGITNTVPNSSMVNVLVNLNLIIVEYVMGIIWIAILFLIIFAI